MRLPGLGYMAIDVPATSPVLNEEGLYRSIRDEVQHFGCDARGALTRLSHSAFNDRGKQPSVDRARMRPGGASESRKSPSDGVVTVAAAEVRAIRTVATLDRKGNVAQQHEVNVVHDPEPNNHSHALVVTAPHAASDGAFKRLKEALCRIAERKGWAFRPESMRR